MVDAQFSSNTLLTQEVIKDMTTEKKLADSQSSCADKPAKKSKISRSIEKRGHKKSCCNSHISDRRTHNRTTIKLTHRKGHRIVKIADFVDVSLLIKQQQVTGRLPQSVDLKDYNEQTVSIFADYIEKKDVKASVSFHALAELIKLTKTFVMEDFQKKLEEILILTAETSTAYLLQAILVAGTANITRETETSIQYMAAWRFVELAHLTNFSNIPYHQFVTLLGSCELNVAHELVVADAALLWLVGQPQPDIFAPGVFAMIRAQFLSKVDRHMIIERIATLQMPESVSRFARMSMESRHNARTCLEEEHVRRHLARCGLVEIENRPKETNLSLSRPRYGIKWMDQDSTKSSKCVKHSKSTKSSFSQRSIAHSPNVSVGTSTRPKKSVTISESAKRKISFGRRLKNTFTRSKAKPSSTIKKPFSENSLNTKRSALKVIGTPSERNVPTQFMTKTKTLSEVEQSKNESEIKSKANIKEKNLKDK